MKGEHALHSIEPKSTRALKSVTHVLGTNCHPCARTHTGRPRWPPPNAKRKLPGAPLNAKRTISSRAMQVSGNDGNFMGMHGNRLVLTNPFPFQIGRRLHNRPSGSERHGERSIFMVSPIPKSRPFAKPPFMQRRPQVLGNTLNISL